MLRSLKAVWTNPYVKVGFFVALLVVVYLLLGAVQPATTIFVAAFVLACLVNPLVDFLQRKKIPRAIGVAIVFSALFGSLYLMIRIAMGSLRRAFEPDNDGGTIADNAAQWFESLPHTMEERLPDAIAQIISSPLESISGLLADAFALFVPHMDGFGTGVFVALSGTVSGAFQLVMIMILTAYILFDFHRLSRSLIEIFPVPYRHAAQTLATRLDQAVGGFVRGQVLIAIMVGVLVFIGLTIIGLPAAGFIALIAGLLNIIPFVGPILPVIPAILLATDAGWVQIVLVIVVFIVVNQIDNQVLARFVLPKSIALHPVSVIIAVIAGFALSGFLGAIAAVPALAFFTALYTEWYQQSRFYKTG